MTNAKKILLAATAAILVFSPALPVFAQCPVPPCGVPEPSQTVLGQNGEGLAGGVALVQKITDWAFTILLVLAVLFIIIAAFKYLFSGGSEEAVGTAHKMLIYAAVAIAVAFLAKGIVFVVQELVTSGYSGGSSSYGNGVGGYYDSNGNWRINVGGHF